MANKHLLFRAAARDKILHGVTALADAVRVTLGPRSKCVLIDKKWGKPIVCNDGVTIAKEIELKDPDENLGARMIREAAEKTGEAVGDGTSTSTILAHAIYAQGLKNVAAGASAIDLKKGLDHGLHVVVAAIKALSRPVEIRVGAPTETEMKSRKEAFDDAISATKAAMAEGIEALENEEASVTATSGPACACSNGRWRHQRGRSPKTRGQTAGSW